MPTNRATANPVPIRAVTVATIVTNVGALNAATSLSQGVMATPMANSSG